MSVSRDEPRDRRHAGAWRAAAIESALIAGGYAIYSLLRDLVPRDPSIADQHGRDLLHAEHDLGISIESTLNHWLSARPRWSQFATFWYSDAHFAVTIALLIATATLRDGRRWRWIWYLSTGIALLVFWVFPTAPPRLLPHAGFIDVVATLPTFGTVSDPVIARLSNPYAAMPSLHVAWALWCAMVIWQLTRRSPHPRRAAPAAEPGRTHRAVRWALRIAAVAYPLTTAWFVLATANHYLADVLAGALTTTFAWTLTSRARRRRRGPCERRREVAVGEHSRSSHGIPMRTEQAQRGPRHRAAIAALLVGLVALTAACSPTHLSAHERQVSFHGLRMSVPAAWSTGHTLCVDRSAVITSPLLTTSCPVTAQGPLDQARTVVVLTCATDPNGFPRSTLIESRLNGEPVLVPDPHGPIAVSYTYIDIPRLNATLTITGPQPTARALLQSASLPARTPPAAVLSSSC
ncbi:MAG TPA: phosphatase PAP2 family protein [Mycobacteriales bacterium]|nr:phosphatase PAP2 family protein [Mycobacteriales bacterium]